MDDTARRPAEEGSPGFPPGFFARADQSPDRAFYEMDRFVTHLDDRARAAVGGLYERLGLGGRVLDLMSSWVSHFTTAPTELVVLGMNARELAANEAATERVVHDLNADPVLPFDGRSFDAAVCCASVDYLVRPVEVFGEVRRVLRPGAPFVLTFSNRCFPTKAISGWLLSDDDGRCRIVADYFRRAGWATPATALCTPPHSSGDPLYAVWAAAPNPSGAGGV